MQNEIPSFTEDSQRPYDANEPGQTVAQTHFHDPLEGSGTRVDSRTDPANLPTLAGFTANASPELPAIPGYELIRMIGRGGMGRVFLARHQSLDRIVALKMLIQGADETLAERLIEEARAVARLQHPNIAQVYDVGVHDQQPYFTMEFANAGTLFDALASRPHPPGISAHLVESLADAIQHCHEHGIVHRDLKPANILLDSATHSKDTTRNLDPKSPAEQSLAVSTQPPDLLAFVPKVSDFGLARQLDSEQGRTATGAILGTPSYMSPEQASGDTRRAGPAADIYALGAILYTCLTGRPPFVGVDPLQTVMMVVKDDPIPPRVLQRDLPLDLNTICLKCLEKDPSRRYFSARELAEDLHRFQKGLPILARPISIMERSWKWARRNPWKSGALATATSLVIAIGVSALVLSSQASRLRTANQELQESKGETERTLQIALGALEKYYFGTSERLKSIPNTEDLRKEILEQARLTLERLGELHPNDPGVREFRAIGFFKLGRIELSAGKVESARQAFTISQNLYQKLLSEYPTEIAYLCEATQLALMQAHAATLADEPDQQRIFEREAEELSQQLLPKHEEDPIVMQIASTIERNRFNALSLTDSDQAEIHLRKCIDWSRRRARAIANDPTAIVDRVSAELTLASWMQFRGQLEEAEAILTSARDSFPSTTDSNLGQRMARALVSATLGRVYQQRQKLREAKEEYINALAKNQLLANNYPLTQSYRLNAAELLRDLGYIECELGNLKVSRQHFDHAQGLLQKLLQDNPQIPAYRTQLTQVERALAILDQGSIRELAPTPRTPK